MMITRYHKKEYLHHYTTSSKPTIVYAYNEMTGNEVIDHWNTWTAIEGTEHKNILYVADTKATRTNARRLWNCRNPLKTGNTSLFEKLHSIFFNLLTKIMFFKNTLSGILCM